MRNHLFAVASLLSFAAPLAAQGAPKTLLLLVEGQVDKATVTAAWRKDFAFVAQRHAVRGNTWVRVLGKGGEVLARVPVDLAHVNLDPAKRGQWVHMGHDRVLSPRIHVHVKVPDFGDRLGSLELYSVEDGRPTTIGRVAAADVRRLLAQSAVDPAMVTVRTHQNNGPNGNRYDIVILGDGYLAADQNKFYSDVTNWMNNLFGREPFKSYRRFFNVHSVFRASAERGADNPRANPPVSVNTVYDSSYWIGNIERCLYVKNGRQADIDAALAPDVETSIAVFVNSPKYGGCGGKYAVSYNGSLGSEVQSHEFGHSYGGLADEYGGSSSTYTGPEPREPNVTKDNTCAKWSLWRGVNGVGCFEGGRYYNRGIFRPISNCLMRSLGRPLCSVCVEDMTKDAYATTNPIENASPAGTVVNLTKPATQTFRFTNLVPGGSNALIQWKVDNVVRQTGGTSFLFRSSSYAAGSRRVVLEVTDRTAFVRKDPTRRLFRTRTWTVNVRDGNTGTYVVYGAPCGETRGCTVLPSAYATKMGESANTFPHARANMRYQQVFLGSEIGGARLWTELCLRLDERFGGPAQSQRIEVRYGDTLRTPTNLGSNFASNYNNNGGTLFNGTLNLPQVSGSGNVNSFSVCVKFNRTAAWGGATTRNLLVEVINRSASAQSHFLDYASGSGVTTARAYAFDANAATAGWVFANQGLVMCLRTANAAPVLRNTGTPRIGGTFRVNLTNAAPRALALFWLGRRAAIRLPPSLAPGCTLYTTPDVLVTGLLTTFNGTSGVTLGVPNSRTLVGARFSNQWHVLHKVNNLGIVYSNGGEGTVGG